MPDPDEPQEVRVFQLDYESTLDMDLRPRYVTEPEPEPAAEPAGPKELAPGPADLAQVPEPPPLIPFPPSALPAPPVVAADVPSKKAASSKPTS
jgi:hypothetical protein